MNGPREREERHDIELLDNLMGAIACNQRAVRPFAEKLPHPRRIDDAIVAYAERPLLSKVFHGRRGRRIQHEQKTPARVQIRAQHVGLLRKRLCFRTCDDDDRRVRRNLEILGQVKRLHHVAVFTKYAVCDLIPLAIRALENFLSVAAHKIDRLFFALHELYQGVCDIFLSDIVLLFNAFDFAVTRIQNDGPERLLLPRHRVAACPVHCHLVLLRKLRLLVGIDQLDFDLSVLL